jgi:hypothetical protein
MTNKANPVVDCQIGDNTFKLLFNFRALCLLEEKTGVNALDGELWASPSASTISTLLWAAMQKFHSEISLEQVQDMLALSDLSTLTDALMEAFRAASPEGDGKKE